MKVRNAVIGMKVQVKRDCCGPCDEFIKGGLVCTVSRIDDQFEADYGLRLEHPDIDGGWAWVNASDVRRYKEEVPEEPLKFLTKGTKVQVKSTLVGEWGESLQEGDIYILNRDEDTAYDGTSRRLDVSPVGGGTSWSTQPKYFDVLPDEVPEEPKTLTLQGVQVGDWVVCNSVDTSLTKGIAYEVVGFTAWGSLLVSNPSLRHARWVTGYAVHPRCFNKILREVNDATPRVVKSGSESTCRSE